jgi:hypothetical protein
MVDARDPASRGRAQPSREGGERDSNPRPPGPQLRPAWNLVRLDASNRGATRVRRPRDPHRESRLVLERCHRVATTEGSTMKIPLPLPVQDGWFAG